MGNKRLSKSNRIKSYCLQDKRLRKQDKKNIKIEARRRQEKRGEGLQRMKCSLQTIHLLPNTPWVIENDNNAVTAFCIGVRRHMFLLAWHNCHSSSIFYLGNINLCCQSVRVVSSTEQSHAASIAGLWGARAKHKPRIREHTNSSVKRLCPALYIICHNIDLV